RRLARTADVVRVHVRDDDRRDLGPALEAAEAGVDEDRAVIAVEHVRVHVLRARRQRHRDPPCTGPTLIGERMFYDLHVGIEYREEPCKVALNRVKGMMFEWSLNP